MLPSALLGAVLMAAALPPLPECRVPFARTGLARQPVTLVTRPWQNGNRADTWVEFRMGEKRLVVHGFEGDFGGRPIGFGELPFFVGKAHQFCISLGPVWKAKGLSKPTIALDTKTRRCVWTRSWTAPKSGRTHVFRYELTAREDGTVLCEYDMGLTEDEARAETSGVPLGLTVKMSKAKWTEADFTVDSRAGSFVSGLSSEDRRFKVATPKGLEARRWDDWTNYQYDFGSVARDPSRVRGCLVFDFGKSSQSVDAGYPPVGGIDFWGADAIHVPARPTRNLVCNGSFEQDFKGWRWPHGRSLWSPCAPGKEKFGIVSGGRDGGRCLVLRGTQPQVASLWSQSMALEPNVPHTLSFWAKATEKWNGFLILAPKSANAAVGKFHWNRDDRRTDVFSVSNGWHRYARTFVPDAHGVFLKLDGNGVMIDDIQVEEGSRATAYVADPIVARLVTSDPDNDLAPDEPRAARLELKGCADSGTVRVRVKNYYSEVRYDRTFSVRVPSTVALDLPDFGTGVFVVRMDFTVHGTVWTDYARYSVASRLRNDRPINRFFANQVWFERFSRGEDIARKMREYGIGMTDGAVNRLYNEEPFRTLFRKNRIGQRIHPVQYELFNHREYPDFAWGKPGFLAWTNATPERLAFVERATYAFASKAADDDVYWTLWNEEENSWAKKIGFDEHFKFVDAAWRGADRAFRDRGLTNVVRRIPSHGCSHYCVWRNYDAIDGYMAAAAKRGVRYDAIGLHTYQNVDKSILGQYDSDVELRHCIDRMRHYGYPEKTPIFLSECWNITPYHLPAWGCDAWADGIACGAASYDLGNREFLHAGALARLYLIAMKYYPKVAMVHSWQAHYCAFLDNNLTPFAWLKMVNTLAEFFPEPQFIGDARPYADVRGYCFTNRRDGRFGRSAILAVWTTRHEVERGTRRGTRLRMRLPADVRFFDLMGNERAAARAADGCAIVPLAPAPLLLVAADGPSLVGALRDAVADDPAVALSLDVRPTAAGRLDLHLHNETKVPQKGVVVLDGQNLRYDLAPNGTWRRTLARYAPEALRLFDWKGTFSLQEQPWSVSWFCVPKCDRRPDWTKLPSLPLTNFVAWTKGERTLKARYQMAWNDERLFIRVEAEDPRFFDRASYTTDFGDHLYRYDGSLEIFFDAFGDARRQGAKGMDENDSRHDFADGLVKRMRAVNWQLAQGTVSATDAEVAEKLERTFTRTAKGYVHEVAFAPRYLAPIDLKAGTVAGVGLRLHDYDNAIEWTQRGVSNATQPGAACDGKPQFWPLFILTD